MDSESRPVIFALYLATCSVHLVFFVLAFWGSPLGEVVDELWLNPSGPMRFYLPIFVATVVLTISFSAIVPSYRWIVLSRIALGVITAAVAFYCFGPTLWLPFIVALPLHWWSYKELDIAN